VDTLALLANQVGGKEHLGRPEPRRANLWYWLTQIRLCIEIKYLHLASVRKNIVVLV
jgi:hypothetical protein